MEADVIDLRAQSILLRRRWRVILLMTVIGLAVAGALAFTQTPTYVARAEVLIDPLTSQTPSNGVIVQADEVATQIQVIGSEPVASLVVDQLQLDETPEHLLKSVVVSPVDVTRALTIQVTRGDGAEAAEIANAFATRYLDYRYTRANDQLEAVRQASQQVSTDLEAELTQITQQLKSAQGSAKVALQARQQGVLVELTQATSQQSLLDQAVTSGGQVLRPATTPQSVASPRPVRMIILGGILGLLLGLGLAYIRDRMDDALRDESRLREVLGDRPVLGHVPHWSGARSNRIATLVDPHSSISEAFRALSTNVRFLMAAHRQQPAGSSGPLHHTLLVSSASEGEGKTSVSTNLAVAAARVGLRVILVDADLRNPQLSKLFGLTGVAGLSDVLATNGSVGDYLLDVGVANLRVLPGGSAPPNPAELLASPSTHALLQTLSEQCDLLILDSAPVLHVADSLELVPRVDLILLVARNGVSRLRQLATAADRIRQVGGSVSGSVFNDVDDRDTRFAYGYHPNTTKQAAEATATQQQTAPANTNEQVQQLDVARSPTAAGSFQAPTPAQEPEDTEVHDESPADADSPRR